MKIIGRKEEQYILDRLVESKKPEFVCVYGRRRVGKTYLIKNYFCEKFSFYFTGIKTYGNRQHLSVFKKQLKNYGLNTNGQFKSWIEAFDGLIELLKQNDVYKYNDKKIIFIDEAPWIDAPKSDFKAGLDYFWNSWGSTQEDLILIVCGSATSWIINNLLKDTGGFYNRITRRLKINPFTILEAKELLDDNDFRFSNKELVESYMVFGGIPYYLNLLDNKCSLSQNIEKLFFQENSELKDERFLLFSSLFKHHEKHEAVLDILFKNKKGLPAKEIGRAINSSNNKQLKTTLDELEQCGFIRRYSDYKTKINNAIYQIIDPFILFSFYALNGNISSWLNFVGTPKYYSWLGYSFETFCLNHVSLIKKSLGINGLVTNEYGFFERNKNEGAQIDLLIDRKDDVINLCEMKYSGEEFEINKDYEENVLKKVNVFKSITKTKKAIKITFVTMFGVKNNSYSHIVDQIITVNDWL